MKRLRFKARIAPIVSVFVAHECASTIGVSVAQVAMGTSLHRNFFETDSEGRLTASVVAMRYDVVGSASKSADHDKNLIACASAPLIRNPLFSSAKTNPVCT